MLRLKTTFMPFAAVLSLAALSAPAAAEASRVSGSVTVGGEKVALLVPYVDESPDDIIIVLAAKEVPEDVIPFIGEEVARKQKIHAVAFTVSRAGRKLAQGFNGVFYPGTEMGFAALREGAAQLELTRLDATGIEGRIWTPSPFTSFDTAIGFDVIFSMPLGTAVPPKAAPTITVTGDSSAPAKAYADYYRAIFAGDMARLRPFMAAARLKEIDAAAPDLQGKMLDLLGSQPHEIMITKATVADSTATLLVEGVNETASKTTGEISMVLEGDAWKVGKERWESASK